MVYLLKMVIFHGYVSLPEGIYKKDFKQVLPQGHLPEVTGVTVPLDLLIWKVTSGYVKIAIENGPVEIVDLPINSMVMFHRFLYVYQAGHQSPDLVIRVIAKPTTRNGRSLEAQKLEHLSNLRQELQQPRFRTGGVVLYSPPQEPHAGHVSGGLKK